MKRAFEIRHHDRKRFVAVKCGKCGFEAERCSPSVMVGRNENEGRYIARGFERSGWVIGKTEKDDRCMHCATSADKLKTKFKVVETGPTVASVFAPKPPAPPAPPPVVETVQKSKPSRAAILALVIDARARLNEIEKLLA